MEFDWRNIKYLNKGSKKQKSAYDVLIKSKIFKILKDYYPVLIGTIPIGIDVEKSDLDIACEVYDFNKFEEVVRGSFSNYSDFFIERIIKECKEVLVANFFVDEFEIEIYAEALPVEKQNGYRHMIIEDRILNIGGKNLKNQIIKFKKEGLKTEPAFAKYLNLGGNPYDELLKIEFISNEDIKKLVNKTK
ncbi:DUF4269 domain-containing protein [Oceanirhabdus sp. W0125-5]|uniref:DUF4269 domain-containing protein n=1 Tax=Oceanirhabdus sp. W0125-5 TaxID=2999116 RepID=UPI0022F31E65|nr:DUF4269 domain-containing protein [Oceanirhabdus sp. W0125-5]WBW96685.1 DUF4269 domain-containing protein [Oceanirhabdus sp. W0125-5]